MGTKRLDGLGDLARHGVPIPVRCQRCGHRTEVRPEQLIARFGWATAPDALPWRCTVCNATGDAIAVGRAARRR